MNKSQQETKANCAMLLIWVFFFKGTENIFLCLCLISSVGVLHDHGSSFGCYTTHFRVDCASGGRVVVH